MWDKNIRLVTFALIYEVIYWKNQNTESKPNLDINLLSSTYEIELDESQKKIISEYVEVFLSSSSELYSQLEEYTTSWSKTYDMVKAIMCTAIIEKNNLSEELTREDSKKIVNKYVQLTQEMIGGKNPNLVFAVVGKIFGV